MFPRHSCNNLSDGATINPVAQSEVSMAESSRRVFGANFKNKFICKFVGMLIFAMGFISATLSKHIHLIVSACAKKKVHWVTAGRIVASVAYHHFFRNYTPMQYPRSSIRPHVGCATINNAIVESVSKSSPLPTAIARMFNYFIPKPFTESFGQAMSIYNFLSEFNCMYFNHSHSLGINTKTSSKRNGGSY